MYTLATAEMTLKFTEVL